MKSGRAFWGTLFLALGALGLLSNFFSVNIDWNTAWKFWPLLLVLLGVSMFMKNSRNKWVLVALIGLTCGVVIFTSLQKGYSTVETLAEGEFTEWVDDEHVSSHRLTTTTFVEAADTLLEEAELTFDSGAGDFRINGISDELFEADVEATIGGYELHSSRSGVRQELHLEPENSNIRWRGKHRNRVAMRLGTGPLWDVHVNIGAAKAELDLRPYRLRRLDIDAGAASIVVRLGDRADTTRLSIETGASSLRIRIPKTSACEVRSESALSSRHFEDFEKIRDGVYRSPNFGDGGSVILVDIESGLSSISIDRD